MLRPKHRGGRVVLEEEATETTETSSAVWNTTNNTNIHSSPFTNEQDVRIAAIELTIAYFQEATVRPEAFFRYAGFMEKFILSGEVPVTDAPVPQNHTD